MSHKQFTITAARVLPPSSLELTYADGTMLRVNVAAIIKMHPTLKRLSQPEIFVQAAVGDWGDSVVWAGDDDLELAADKLRARAIEQAGGASHEMLWNWMDRHHLTLDTAAKALGLSRRMLAYYRSGEKPVPRTVELACLGWEVEQRKARAVTTIKPSRSKTGLIIPTDDADATINRGIAADPDTLELKAEHAARLMPFSRRRPPVEVHPQASITMHIDADVLAAIKHSDKGWQTRLNEVLREDVAQGKFKAA